MIPRSGGSGTEARQFGGGALRAHARTRDWMMLVLAAVSAGLLGFALLEAPPAGAVKWIFYADCAVCAMFALDVSRRWRRDRWQSRDFENRSGQPTSRMAW